MWSVPVRIVNSQIDGSRQIQLNLFQSQIHMLEDYRGHPSHYPPPPVLGSAFASLLRCLFSREPVTCPSLHAGAHAATPALLWWRGAEEASTTGKDCSPFKTPMEILNLREQNHLRGNCLPLPFILVPGFNVTCGASKVHSRPHVPGA